MATQIKIPSACGRSFGYVDLFDLDLNIYGVECCGECRTIIESRDAWMDRDGDFISNIERISRIPDNDPFYVR